MSFGPSNTTKTAENNLSGTSNALLNQQYPLVTGFGTNAFQTGASNITPGTNFLNTVLQGNRANTTALLQPQIDQIRAGNTGTLGAISTLMPRGGGRSSALFGQSFAPQAQIQNLFNPLPATAAQALPQIGLQQEQVGTNLFGLGTQTLNAATGANTALGQLSQRDREMSMLIDQAIGKGLFGLLTTPFGGGSASQGLLGLLPKFGGTAGGGTTGGGGGGFTPYGSTSPFDYNIPGPSTGPYVLGEPPAQTGIPSVSSTIDYTGGGGGEYDYGGEYGRAGDALLRRLLTAPAARR